MKAGPIASGGFTAMDVLVPEEDRDWWEYWLRHRTPVDGEDRDLARFDRAARRVAQRQGRCPVWRFAGFVYDDILQVARIGILVGLRTWHTRPDSCTSLLSWVWRSAQWVCLHQRRRLTITTHIVKAIRLVPASALDSHREEGEQSFFEELVSDKPEPPESDMMLASIAVSTLRSKNLHRMADVLGNRLFDGLTLQQIADNMHISRERVRQLETKAAALLVRCPSFRSAALQFWPSWNLDPTAVDFVHSNKPHLASKRPPKPPPGPAERKSTSAMMMLKCRLKKAAALAK